MRSELSDWAAAGIAPRTSTFTPAGWLRADWSTDELERIAADLAADGAAALASVPIERRLAAWCSAIEALLDPESDERRALLPALLATARLSPEGLVEALDVVLGGVGEQPARARAAQLPSTEERAPIGVVLAANLPALAVETVLPALLLGRPLLLRSSTREPLFAPALVAALAAREPALGTAFAALAWPHARSDLTRAAFGPMERVIGYGAADSTEALSRAYGERFHARGPKASVALVAGVHDPLVAARRIARDVALVDQRGCLSVQAVWTTGDARELAQALAWALAIEARRLPPGPIEPATAVAVQQLRGAAALSGALIGDLSLEEGSVLLADGGFRPVPGLRTVRVHGVATLAQALDELAPARGQLQGAALEGDEATARGDEIATRLGLARVAPAGELQRAGADPVGGGVAPIDLLL